MTTVSKPSNGLNQEHGHRRKAAQRSGGFLLQEAEPAQVSKTLSRPQHQLSNGTKGKERAESEDGSFSKRLSVSRHPRKSSIGNSPLSAVIYSDTNGSEAASSNSHNSNQGPSPQSQAPPQMQAISNGTQSSGQHSESESHSSKDDAPSAIGYNTDPSQIVNLALSLSESRRRHASGGRLSPVYVNGNRRQFSSEHSGPRLSGNYTSAGGANLRKHLNEQRRISRSSALSSGVYSQDSPPPASVRSSSGSDAVQSPIPYGTSVAPEAVVLPSDATLARAEKAKIAFELLYEYRRLLQHLPKLPKPPSVVTSASRIESESENNAWNEFGRAYNPLQYIRNRRVRGKDRKYFDAEVEGWRDLDRVRRWVDQVASEPHIAGTSSGDHIALPSLDSVLPNSLPPETPVAPDDLPSGNIRPVKSERQQSNWAFTSQDLLADAAWLSREDNIRLIEDAKRKKIPPRTNKTVNSATPRTSLDDNRPLTKRPTSPIRKSLEADNGQVEPITPAKKTKSQKHTHGQSSDTRSSLKHLENTRDRKGRWHRNFIRSRSLSSSGSSMDHSDDSYAWGRHHDRDGLDSAALEKHMMRLLAKEINDDPFSQRNAVEQAQEQSESGDRAMSTKQEKDNSSISQQDARKTSPERRTRNVPAIASPKSPGSSLEESRGRQPRTSFDDIEFSTPSSPNGFQFGPSIFINRTAPNSRSVSPKKPLHSRFKHHLRSRSDSRRSTNETDFANNPQSPTRSAVQRNFGVDLQESHSGVPKSDSASNLLSPITAELFGKRFRRSNNSSASIRGSKDPESRFRGLLKGGRIAELVGNEVSRVGDMIWRRDGSNLSQTNSPASVKALVDSDTEGDFSTMENSPETDLSRVTTNNDDGGNISRISTTSNQPKYHYQNLPNFRSSISQASHKSPVTSSPEDHPITRQQMAQKARGRSSKFDRLAPPKIDIRNISPSASPPLSRYQSNDNSRDASSSRSTHRIRSADRRLNDMLGIPGTVRNAVAPTGLTNYSSKSTKHTRDTTTAATTTRPHLADRQWSISDRSVSNTRGGGAVTNRDIARVRALLLSSGIKANEIARQANSIDDPPFLPQLRELHRRWDRPIPKVPRAQEHLLTAKLTVQEIDATNQALRDAAEIFSNDTVEALHQKFRTLDERVTATLIPGARSSADDADALSAELTTDLTLAVKRVNDGVDMILRRRRRRM
ncbi:MAG: hypothetical protein Q9222_005393, partial [Ikaeria aurantiellina]